MLRAYFAQLYFEVIDQFILVLENAHAHVRTKSNTLGKKSNEKFEELEVIN